jgi:hypothetical protein
MRSAPEIRLNGKRPESALCSRWPTTRRMGEDAPFPSLRDQVTQGPFSSTRWTALYNAEGRLRGRDRHVEGGDWLHQTFER